MVSTATRIFNGFTDVFTITDSSSSANNITLSALIGAEGEELLRVNDTFNPITAGTGTTQFDPSTVDTAQFGVGEINLATGEGDDTINIEGADSDLISLIVGAEGIEASSDVFNDITTSLDLEININGGEGDDTVNVNNIQPLIVNTIGAAFVDSSLDFSDATPPPTLLDGGEGYNLITAEGYSEVNINGDENNDTINIDSSNSLIDGAEGFNFVFGDVNLSGAEGVDFSGARGVNVIAAEGQNHVHINGGEGSDIINVNNGFATFGGEGSAPLIDGAEGFNVIVGGVDLSGAEGVSFDGGEGINVVAAEGYNHVRISGGDNNDTINVDNNDSLIDGAEGFNFVIFDSDLSGAEGVSFDGGEGLNVVLAQGENYVDIEGNHGDDTININNNASLIDGAEGFNFIFEGSSDFTGSSSIDFDGAEGFNFVLSEYDSSSGIYSGNYVDIYGGEGNDTITVNNNSSLIDGAEGYNFVIADGAEGFNYVLDEGDNEVNIDGGQGNDLISAEGGSPLIIGAQGINIVSGEGLNVVIFDGDNHVFMYGGEGNDTINLDNSGPLIIGAQAINFTEDAGVNIVASYGHNHVDIDGGEGDDQININSTASFIVAAESFNSAGGGAFDLVYSGGDNEIDINGGEGNDTINVANSASLIDGGEGYNEIDIEGNESNDVINVDSTASLIDGSEGAYNEVDIEGDEGNDTINVKNIASLIDGGEGYNQVEIEGDQGVSGTPDGGMDTITIMNFAPLINAPLDGGEGYGFYVGGGEGFADIYIDGAEGYNDVFVYGDEGNDTINVSGSASLINAPINSGEGSGGSFVGPEGFSGTYIDGPEGINFVDIHGGEGNDTINVMNSDSLINAPLTSEFSGGIPSFGGEGFSGLYIDGPEGFNDVHIDGDEGNDTIDINSTAPLINAPITVDGSVIVTSTLTTGEGFSGLYIDGPEGFNAVEIDGGEGMDTININSTAPLINAPLVSGEGSGYNYVSIDGGEGSDTINVNSSAPLIVGEGFIEIGNYGLTDDVALNQTADLVPTIGLELYAYQLTQTTPLGGAEGFVHLSVGEGEAFFDQNNTYDGQTVIHEGVLNISNANALGSAEGNTIVEDDAELYITSSITVDEDLVLDGELGVGTPGGGVNAIWSGDIFLTDEYPSFIGGEGPIVVSSSISAGEGFNPPPIIEANNATDELNITGMISGEGGIGVDVVGEGTVIFSNTNSYTGTTTVNEGVTLLVNGSISSGEGFSVEVNDDATLGGNGTVDAPVNVNDSGNLAPGNSTGVLDTGDLNLNDMSQLQVEIGGTTAGTDYDQVNVTGTVNIAPDATLDVQIINSFLASLGDSFTIVNNDGTDGIIGTFDGLGEGATVSSVVTAGTNTRGVISYVGGEGENDIVIDVVQLNVVDPPSNTGGITTGGSDPDVIDLSSTTGGNRADAGANDDYIIGSPQADNLQGGTGNDTIFGNANSDFIYGGSQSNPYTGTGNDVLNGGADSARDYLFGGDGADTYVINPNNKNDIIFTFNDAQGDRFKLEGGLTFGSLSFSGASGPGIYNGSDLLATVRGDLASSFAIVQTSDFTSNPQWFV